MTVVTHRRRSRKQKSQEVVLFNEPPYEPAPYERKRRRVRVAGAARVQARSRR